MTELLTALCLVLVIEGLLPLASPSRWREVFRRVLDMSDGQIRFLGLASCAAGVAGMLLLR